MLQFEVGIQSFNEEVQKRISRKQDNALTVANLRWLQQHSHAHLHTDLIFGLPGESLQSFADGFDRLYALRPHEIQLGLLNLKTQLDTPEWAAMGCAGKARRRCGLLPARRSNAASRRQRGSIGCVALSPLRRPCS